MARVVVIGGSAAGLAAALMLARAGHQVRVLERDAAPVPEAVGAMWSDWHRPGTPQARLVHAFLARGRNLLRDHLPDVRRRLLAAGADESDLAARAPHGAGQPGDEDLVQLLCRRPVYEGVLRRVAEAEPNVRLDTGRVVVGLLTQPAATGRVPRAVGVRVADGEPLAADIVVDAAGRRSRVLGWLADAGARPPDESVSSGDVVYYSRHYALLDGVEAPTDRPAIGNLPYLRYLCGRSDNRTFLVNLTVPAWDRAWRALRHEAAWRAAMRALPALAPLVEADRAAPIGPVAGMGSLDNRVRRFVGDDGPVCHGLHVIGDALCHTSPVLGYGLAQSLVHAVALADAVAGAPDDPAAQARALDAAIGPLARDCYAHAVAANAAQLRLFRGEAPLEPTPDEDAHGFAARVLPRAAAADPTIFRALARHRQFLTPPGALPRDAALLARAQALIAAQPRPAGSLPLGPSRPELLALIAKAC